MLQLLRVTEGKVLQAAMNFGFQKSSIDVFHSGGGTFQLGEHNPPFERVNSSPRAVTIASLTSSSPQLMAREHSDCCSLLRKLLW